MSVTGIACAIAAEAAADQFPPIPYGREDCQAFIEQTVRRAGGTIKDYRGSNDMFRNACSLVIPLSQAKLQPGMVLFIVRHDGKEPARYKSDGKGNASHVGWYTGRRHEVVHSSASRRYVAPSTLKNGWTHAGYLKGVDYDQIADDYKNKTTGKEGLEMGIGHIDLPPDSNVFLRISPSKTSKWFTRIPGQDPVEIVSSHGGWTRVKWYHFDGYVDSKFVISGAPERLEQTEENAKNEPTNDGWVTIRIPEGAAHALKQALEGVG